MSNIDHVKLWKMKKIIKMLSTAKGNGTSMISLIIPTSKSIPLINSMLTNEYRTATNIKSKVNRLSVLTAISSAQNKLKTYKSIPDNGLALYCGIILMDDGKDKKVSYVIEPFKPLTKFIYLCDSKFHTNTLEEAISSDEKYGFIVMDGNGALYGLLCGSSQSVIHKFKVSLPKKHRAGGQSALRFSRLREEARNNFVRKVGELAVSFFITNDISNVKGLILAGSADFKSVLSSSPHLDPRLKKVIIHIVDISYGGLSGFNQAIELSSSALENVKLIEEKKILDLFFNEINQDTGKYCFGIKQTMDALEQGAVETLIVWEYSDIERYVLTKSGNNNEIIKYCKKGQIVDAIDPDTKMVMDIKSCEEWTEWIAENYKTFGTNLEFVTDQSSIGTQFAKGFGGIAGILRWAVKFDFDVMDFDEKKDDDLASDNDSIGSDFDDFF